MDRYVRFAEVYDKMGADRFSAQMTNYVFEIIRHFEIKVSDVLDICCGTGTACRMFAGSGLNVAGLDRSRHMLGIARKKLKGTGVKLYHQELPEFLIPQKRGSKAPKQFDLATSFFDSLNYLLTRRDLRTAFSSAHRHLRPGGHFVFDMNTPYALQFLWDGQEHSEVRDDLVTVWRNEYREKNTSATCHATFLVKRGRHWERFDEEHVERSYSNADIKRLLRESGFIVRGFFDCLSFESPGRETYRICAVARKK